MNGRGYGMPSSHAQFVSFFSVYFTLFLLLRHKPHPTETHTPLPFHHRVLLSIAALGSAAAVAWSRIYLNYHTPKQVLVGISAGIVCAIFWFAVTTFLRRSGWLSWALDLSPARYFRMRDLVVTEDLMDAGWARWDARRRKRDVGTKKGR
jgi:dolichyldiphosphatase